MSRSALLEPEAQAPEIHRNSPFEYEVTAESEQVVVIYSRPILVARPWVAKGSAVATKPSLPSWMTAAQKE